ncbi:MAG: HAMP domain-containing histidine kinase [Rhodobiaceae bacterium]|nr:HAMP domain-containing histidine kinase [Rhodobiaceae bacterium]MCC0012868.1 HAMP domain-containing histidine kinase [Rhodobiaceae bacterium]MCC0019158.1 HAMP domain-containing histidine kinase [Rhodobiaceae bacterium]MCC0051048.1 HAMP domain-containing histidine kinase [Rhodobiaceae bacterium]MCC0060105.1 HAMP domain-containing histidine kinase [Rhodobiaceae bacterium]
MSVLRSLRLRLVAYAAGVVAIVLVVAGIGLTSLFSRHLERRIGSELDVHIAQLSGSLRIATDGALTLAREPADPSFSRIYGGLYWQINDATSGKVLRSRSLWDSALALPDDALEPGTVHAHETEGPGGQHLLVHEQAFLVSVAGRDHDVRLSVALDRAEVAELESDFARDITPALALLGFFLLAGFSVQIGAGLRPLGSVRDSLADIRAGRKTRLASNVPSEVAPLVDEINELLAAQEADLVRARDRAADLAHGLKTPLTALATDIARLRDKGEVAIADDLDDLALRMRRHTERELARARVRHNRLAVTVPVGAAAAGIVRTLERTPHGSGKVFQCDIASDLNARMDGDDLVEVLGNLMENATRHAQSRIFVSAYSADDHLVIAIEDDGPGLDKNARAMVLARGQRLDEAGSGAGLGLAIVRDILIAYDGDLDLDGSGHGGLKVVVSIPA